MSFLSVHKNFILNFSAWTTPRVDTGPEVSPRILFSIKHCQCSWRLSLSDHQLINPGRFEKQSKDVQIMKERENQQIFGLFFLRNR